MKPRLAGLVVLVAAAITTPSLIKFTQNGTGGTSRTLASKLSDTVSVKDFGAVGDGSADDTTAIQAAINTGINVLIPSGTYKLTTSLFMGTASQTLSGEGVLTMASTLAKPMLWLGATDANGTTPGSTIVNMKVRGLVFSCTGARTSGSSGISFGAATTTTVDSAKVWGCYAGIDVRGLSLVNSIINADLRQNNYGFWDKADGTATINFQGSQFFGGRIEQNVQEGVVLGSADVRFVGTIIEGNSNVGQGGTGAEAEIRVTAGFATGSLDLVGVYMETTASNSTTRMIQVDDAASRRVDLISGSFVGNDATNRNVIQTSSTSTVQSFALIGGQFSTFKNYISGTITNGSTATVLPSWSDASRDVTATLTASSGATIIQTDRILGVKTGLPWSSTVASGSNAIVFNTAGARLQFGTGASYLYSDGSGRVRSDGNIVGVSLLTNGGVVSTNQVASLDIRGAVADGASARANRSGNSNALSTAGAESHSFYSDNFSTHVAAITFNGGFKSDGVTFANLGTPANGISIYCSDCTIANPCANAGTGAFAKRLNGVWVCN